MNASPPPERAESEALHRVSGWRVALASDVPLPGWLVAVPDRHVVRLDDLTDTEATGLGPLLRLCSKVLATVTSSTKSYIAFFGEAEGFEHLHIHVIPRAPELAAEMRGPKVFELLALAGESAAQDDAGLTQRLRRAFQTHA